MSGSEQQSKTSQVKEQQLPLKGFVVPWILDDGKHEAWIEGMGGARYRIGKRKRQPEKK